MKSSHKLNWKPYWLDAARSLKRAVLSRRVVELVGEEYTLAYEARLLREAPDYRLLKQCARDKACVFDIGANVGTTALVMSSSMAAEGILYAFEASESSCLTIRENALLNGVHQKIHVINALLAEESGQVKDYHWDFVSGRASMLMQPPSGSSIPLQKATLRLDDFVEGSRVRPDFLKIDVEGAENQVLAGTQRTLRSVRPLVYVELHAWPGTPVSQNVETILAQLAATDYRMLWLRTQEFVTSGEVFASLREAAGGVESRTRVLLIPSEAGPPAWLSSFDTIKL